MRVLLGPGNLGAMNTPSSTQTEATSLELHGTLYHLEASWSERVYLLLVSVFVTLLVLTNIIGAKLFYWFDFPLTAGIITYPLTFLCTDIVSEIYGKKRADRMVVLGFAMSVLMLATVQATIYLPPAIATWKVEGLGFADGRAMQRAWKACFGVGPWLVTGSMLAYLSAQLCDNFLFHFWRRLTKGKYLWLRNNGSTPVSQLVDTFIVNSFLFYGFYRMGWKEGLVIMGQIYLFKLAIALADTPFCYLGVWGVRRFLRRMGELPASPGA